MSKYVELAFDHIEHETDQAIKFEMGEPEPVWIPKSCINMDEFEPESHVVEVSESLAQEKGLI